MNKFFEEMQKKGQENYELTAKSFEVATKGAQDLSKEATDFSQKSFEATSAAVKDIMSANSVEKAIELQGNFAKSSYDQFVAQATKMGEMYTSVAKEVYAPFEAAFSAK